MSAGTLRLPATYRIGRGKALATSSCPSSEVTKSANARASPGLGAYLFNTRTDGV